MQPNLLPNDEESIDDLLLGGMKIIQARHGYRFSLDAVILAHFPDLHSQDKVIDFGTGNGVIPLIMAHRFPHLNITGLELQEAMANRAYRNVLLNKLENRIKIINGDIRNANKLFAPQTFDLLVSNPPFFRLGGGYISKDNEQAIARHELELSLRDLIANAALLLKSGGRMVLIYRSERLMDLFNLLPDYQLKIIKIRFIHSQASKQAKLFLVEIEKQGKGQMIVLPPLIIYATQGVYSSEISSYYSF